jgi:hypothetical protein
MTEARIGVRGWMIRDGDDRWSIIGRADVRFVPALAEVPPAATRVVLEESLPVTPRPVLQPRQRRASARCQAKLEALTKTFRGNARRP